MNLFNLSWGVKIRELDIVYRSDDAQVNICRGITVEKCSNHGQVLRIPIRSIGTDLWEGEYAEVEVRICSRRIPDLKGYNISYTITGFPTTRGGVDGRPVERIQFDSNMYAEI